MYFAESSSVISCVCNRMEQNRDHVYALKISTVYPLYPSPVSGNLDYFLAPMQRMF